MPKNWFELLDSASGSQADRALLPRERESERVREKAEPAQRCAAGPALAWLQELENARSGPCSVVR